MNKDVYNVFKKISEISFWFVLCQMLELFLNSTGFIMFKYFEIFIPFYSYQHTKVWNVLVFFPQVSVHGAIKAPLSSQYSEDIAVTCNVIA